ncbi:MAG: DUF4125 family protein [Firmicutes bacterium]|nr:DUF4125 family protein [Bacillota bacterium]
MNPETKIKIEKIINTEWEMFQNVDNIGGRASCQDDYETFFIMRASQYGSWPIEMIELYRDFVENCRNIGRNLLTEKYGRMMKYTHPAYYEKNIAPALPEVPAANYVLIDSIVKSMIIWESDFARRYPKISGVGRPLTSDGDASGFTSMETYARGELATYPAELLKLYVSYVDKLKEDGLSLSILNQEIMVKLYGYDTIEEAEASL